MWPGTGLRMLYFCCVLRLVDDFFFLNFDEPDFVLHDRLLLLVDDFFFLDVGDSALHDRECLHATVVVLAGETVNILVCVFCI